MNWLCPMAPAQEPSICADRDVALIEDAQRVQQLAAEERRAPAVVGQGRERADHRELAVKLP